MVHVQMNQLMSTYGSVTKTESQPSQDVGSLRPITISDLKLFEVAQGCSLSGTLATSPLALVPSLLSTLTTLAVAV